MHSFQHAYHATRINVAPRPRGPIVGIVNGVIGSIALWAIIAGLVAVVS
ncbi:hypothetical protein [uncultured Sphingomonas sp.]|nr:hypothetical protein [uncultured Sphingomonas sp.]